jgi:UDP-N-acetylglucosamine--N-acetylmuramyl-(pentapeptide) pyrophosphoryl-undecaprenol N-acetylglucosamine transferase
MREYREALPEAMRSRYHVVGFLDDMPSAMAAADLALMRSGASVLGELPAAGLPAVLVPGVYAAGHNQRDNARLLEQKGAAVVLEESQLGRLSETVRELLADTARRESMAQAMRGLARPNAARDIASLLEEVAA